MPTQLLEAPPVLTREQIVNALCQKAEQQLGEFSIKLRAEREMLDDPSETDRDAQALHRRRVGQTIAQIEDNIADMRAFKTWLERQEPRKDEPLTTGNIWILNDNGDRLMWLIYDPQEPRQGSVVSVSIGDAKLQEEFGVNEILTLSVGCPLYQRYRSMVIREGADLTVGVEGNDYAVYRLEQVL